MNSVKKEELEFKEKFYPIFRLTDNYNSIGEYFPLTFNYLLNKEIAIEYLNDGKIYLPKNKEFKGFEDFIETKQLKTYSYYSILRKVYPYEVTNI